MRASPFVTFGLAFSFSPPYSMMAWPVRTEAVSRNGFAKGFLSLSSG